MELYTKIIIAIIVISFLIPSNTRMNHLRVKGWYKTAEAIEALLMGLAIICQWTWYIGFGLLIFNIIKAIF